ncbi:tetratricopeptide repeat protein 19, mitochondrial-like [Babylonia areolata]|uniref:tetratricopeptide repeat protein 19, mitochondrial-like n=1 Tax=Babylonia areolata TaxID=304850 RepID=UPI003FD59F93
MAAAWVRRFSTVLRTPVRCGTVPPTATPTLRTRHLQNSFTGSHVKYFHSRSSVPPSVFTPSSRYGYRWLVAMATAGFTQGFLGFSFGKKEDKKEDPLISVFREAKEALLKQDFGKAEIRYHDALRVADEMLKLKKINMKTYVFAKTNIYDSLADMALGQGQLEKAERLYKETMKGCLQQGLAQDDNAIIELSLKLASVYAMLERDGEAEQGLLFCVKAQDAKLAASKADGDQVLVSDAVKEMSVLAKEEGGSVSAEEVKLGEEEMQRNTEALLGMALETYGRLLMGQRRLDESVEALERAAGIAEKVLGTEQSQYLVLVNDLATAHILLKNFDKATTILNKAIVTATKVQSSQLPVLYCNLGALFLRTARLSEAEAACAKGQELSRQHQHSMAASMSQKCLEKIAQLKASAKAKA